MKVTAFLLVVQSWKLVQHHIHGLKEKGLQVHSQHIMPHEQIQLIPHRDPPNGDLRIIRRGAFGKKKGASSASAAHRAEVELNDFTTKTSTPCPGALEETWK